jgi:hypothetical protein
MAKNWSAVLTAQAASWNVPPKELTQLDGLAAAAGIILDKAQSSERTAVITAQCKAAFDGLTEKMRFVKNHFFLTPPLTDSDLIALGLKPRDTIHTAGSASGRAGGSGHTPSWGASAGTDPAGHRGRKSSERRGLPGLRERFDFDGGDSGKTAYFCIRLENAKGEAGPWGALFSAVIP